MFCIDFDDNGMRVCCATVYKREHYVCLGVCRRVRGRVYAYIRCVFVLREGQDILKLTLEGIT